MQLVPKMHTRLDIEKDSLMHFAVQNGYMLPFTLHVWLSLTYGIIRKKRRIWVRAISTVQTKIIRAFHSSTIDGHSEIQATYQKIQKLFC
jgi:hypothetical protein